MTSRSINIIVTLVLGVVTIAVLYPFLAPVIMFATTGTAIDWTTYLSGLNLSVVQEFWGSGTWSAHIQFILVTFIVISIILYVCISSNHTKGDRTVEKGIYGDARIIRGNTELKRRNDFWNGKGTPKSAGLVMGASKRGYWYDSSVPHSLTVGKTGSGKTQLQVLETMHLTMAAGWNLLVTGKSELIELTADKARELGLRVVVFDLSGYPGASRYNPLALVREYVVSGLTEEAVRCARQVASDLVPVGDSKNEYFSKAARNLITAVILIVCVEDEVPDDARNLSSVAAIIDRGTTGNGKDPSEPLKAYIRGLGPRHLAFSPASDFLSDGGLTTAGKNVLSTAKEALSIFSDDGMRRTTSTSDVPMHELFEQRSVTYMTLREPGDPYLVVNKCFMNQWWRVAQEVASKHGGRVPHETAIIGDELGNVRRIDALPQIATLGRSYKIHLYAFVQNLGQMNDYNSPGDNGAGREKILGSIGIKVALALAEPNDGDWFTKLAGKYTARSRGTNAQNSGGKASSGESYSETAVDLIKTQDWLNRIPIRDGLIAIKGGENSKPGREGVFEFPLAYANNTPAGTFFSLGTEEEEMAKKIAYYKRALAKAAQKPASPEPWCPDFKEGWSDAEEYESAEADIEHDEWEAWD